MILEVYDLECLRNIFTYTGYCPKENKYYQFVICNWRNDLKELQAHLTRDQLIQVGFNNEGYDYPLLHHILNHFNEYKFQTGQEVACALYTKSQDIIQQEFSIIADKNKYIQQIDLYRIHHFNNKARIASLKDIEIAMRLPDVQEMPIHHTTWCKEGDEELILVYNKWDVYSTYQFFLITLGKTDNPIYHGRNKIELRQKLQKKFQIPCLNWPDVKIGEQLITKLYCDKTFTNPYELKKRGGTPRSEIHLKDCIPLWANFKTKEFNKIKSKFENTVITDIKGSFNESVYFHGIQMDYGTGGLHSCIKPGIYESNEEWMILDEDVGSLYPSLAIQLGLYPEHLGKTYLDVYDGDIVSVRLAEKRKPKKERDMVIMEGFKLAANGVYGKSGEESSVLYDPLYTMKTTIGGQMFLSLWTEKLVEAIPRIKFIQHNTDGITYLLPRKDLEKAKAVGKEMTKLTGLYIEDNIYSKVVIRDVNNYLAVYEDGNIKLKGCFEINKEFHKDPSMRIVPIALKEFFVNGIPIRETIINHKDIYDFCLRLKTNSKSIPKYTYIDPKTKEIKTKDLARTTRYYISNNGGTLFKEFKEKRNIVGVNIGYSATLFNKYIKRENFKEYNINYQFYIVEAMKIINTIINREPLSLFGDEIFM